MMDYGLIFISHSVEKTLKDNTGKEYTQLMPAAPTKARDIVNKLVDFIIYAGMDYSTDPDGRRVMYLRGTKEILAGSRFKYVPDKIDFSYENLVKAVNDAVDKQIDGKTEFLSEDKDSFYEERKMRPFIETMDEAKKVWTDILTKDSSDKTVVKMNKIVEDAFGQKIKLSTAAESQQELLETVIVNLKEFVKTL